MQEIEKLLEERGSVYGDFYAGTLAEASILGILRNNYSDAHHAELSLKHQVWLSKIITKLVRLSVSPNHLDSWIDISGYATLVANTLEKTDAKS